MITTLIILAALLLIIGMRIHFHEWLEDSRRLTAILESDRVEIMARSPDGRFTKELKTRSDIDYAQVQPIPYKEDPRQQGLF